MPVGSGRFRSRPRWTRGLALLLLASWLSACTTHHPILPSREAIQTAVQPGSQVRVTTLDQQSRVFVVRKVTDSGLSGDGVTIGYGEIDSIELQEIAAGKTAGLLLLVAGAVVLTGYLLFLANGPDIDFN